MLMLPRCEAVTDTVSEFEHAFTTILRDYLQKERGKDGVLKSAHEEGWKACSSGIGVAEMAKIQVRALSNVLGPTVGTGDSAHAARLAADIVAESLYAFEMVHNTVLKAHACLRESERRYQNLIALVPDVVFTVSLDGKITSLNPAVEPVTGWSRDGWLNQPYDHYLHPDDLPLAKAILQRIRRGETPPSIEVRVRTKSGKYLLVEVTAAPIERNREVIGAGGIARDITKRKQVEMAQRHLNETLEREAKRIAHALHDEAGQLLTSVHLTTERIARDLPPDARERLRELRAPLQEVENHLRCLSHELRPTILDDLGLQPALEFLAKGISKRSGVPITVEADRQMRLPPSIEIALYRIVQEGLTNMAKHSRATHARVQLQPECELVRCSLRDDGIGFDVAMVRAQRGERGIGLVGMAERAEALGGRLEITSTPGRGTDLVVTIPLER